MQLTQPLVSSGTAFAPVAPGPNHKQTGSTQVQATQQIAKCARPSFINELKADNLIQPSFPKAGCALPFDFVDKNSPERLIETTLKQATRPMGGWSNEYALRHLMTEAQTMSTGEIDDVKDAIVKRMASPNTSQTERDILKDMYTVVDAISENRPVPHHLIAHPRYEVYPTPRF